MVDDKWVRRFLCFAVALVPTISIAMSNETFAKKVDADVALLRSNKTAEATAAVLCKGMNEKRRSAQTLCSAYGRLMSERASKNSDITKLGSERPE